MLASQLWGASPIARRETTGGTKNCKIVIGAHHHLRLLCTGTILKFFTFLCCFDILGVDACKAAPVWFPVSVGSLTCRFSRLDVSHVRSLGHALSASVLLVLSPLGGDVIDVGLLIEFGHIYGFG